MNCKDWPKQFFCETAFQKQVFQLKSDRRLGDVALPAAPDKFAS
jgi:hypothetical protein